MNFKPKICKHCGTSFVPQRSMAVVCSPICAIRMGKAKKAQDRVALRQRKAALKTNGEKKAEAQSALNRWVVHGRDAGKPCISCGRMHEGAWHGGHYRSRGSAPHLALDPRNVHKQCAPCNVYLHGNLINFRLGLIERYGAEFAETLEADQEPRHYMGDDYEAIKAEYVAKLKAEKEKT